MTEVAVDLFPTAPPPFRSVGCAGCGRCCDPVWLQRPPEWWSDTADVVGELARRGEATDAQVRLAADAAFIRDHMRLLDPQPPNEVDGIAIEGLAYACDAFDPVSRLCTAHDARPPICRGYPWYGDRPEPSGSVLYRECSYWRDLPVSDRLPDARPLIPVEDVTARLSTG